MAGLSLGSLCTGYGGLDLAVEAVLDVERTVFVADIAPAANQVLQARFSGVPNLGDIRSVDWSQVPRVDVLTAGYPCQPFSLAGYRKGEDDPRHLWPQVLRAVRALRPALLFLENVRGHLSKGFDAVLGDLAAAGYDASWTCLRASDIGAPHPRLRLFALAWPVAAHPAGFRAQRRRNPRDLVRPAGPARQTQPGQPAPRQHQPRHVPGDHRRPARPQPGPHSPPLWWIDADGRDYRQAIARWEAVLGRPAPYPICYGSTGRAHLTPAFGEWLMGLDEGYVTGPLDGVGRKRQLALLGNGVVPQQAQAALTGLLGLDADEHQHAEAA